MESEYEKKREILKDIIMKEEDVLAQLQRLVKLAKPFIKIEENTGRIVLMSDFPLTNYEKIFLLLLGKFFAYHSRITKETTVKIRELSDDLGIKVTTLSAPLGRLVEDHFVSKPQKDAYQVNPHQVEVFLKELTKRYSAVEKKNRGKVRRRE